MKAGKAMAQDAGKRPEFPDNEHPLYTPDEDAQRQVVARIAQGRQGPRERRSKNEPTYSPGTIVLDVPKPMGQHHYIGRDKLRTALGVGKDRAKHLVEHPEDMDRDTVHALCELLGVTLEWLRGWDATNGFRRYESAEVVAEVYRRLPTKDKELVWHLLHRLADQNDIKDVWMEDVHYWMEHKPWRS